MISKVHSDRSTWADLFSGAGIGLLLGTILGLSTTPVVATVVGALSSVLAIFLGLDGREASLKLPSVNAVRIGAFGFATIAGLALGLHMRINNPIAADPSVAMERWNAAFPDHPTLARQMMVYERTALVPAQIAYGKDGGEAQAVTLDATVASAKQSVLFSRLSDYDACARLDPARFATADDALAAYRRGDPPMIVRSVGNRLDAVPPENRTSALALAHDILCSVQREQQK